jgi:hypothetical protein
MQILRKKGKKSYLFSKKFPSWAGKEGNGWSESEQEREIG